MPKVQQHGDVGSGRGRRGRGARVATTLSEINVIPLVDVMLVLLVIFMVTAPMMQQGVQVNLPKAETKAITPLEEAVVVSVDREGKVFINTTEVTHGDLKGKLSAMVASRAK